VKKIMIIFIGLLYFATTAYAAFYDCVYISDNFIMAIDVTTIETHPSYFIAWFKQTPQKDFLEAHPDCPEQIMECYAFNRNEREMQILYRADYFRNNATPLKAQYKFLLERYQKIIPESIGERMYQLTKKYSDPKEVKAYIKRMGYQ